MGKYVGSIILYLLLGFVIGAFNWWHYQPFIKKIMSRLETWAKIPRKPLSKYSVEFFTNVIIFIDSIISILIIMIPIVYLGVSAKNLPLNLVILNITCVFVLFIGYHISDKLKTHLENKQFTSNIVRVSFGSSRKLRKIIESGIDINEPNIDGRTALMLAAYICKTENVRLLLESGADVRATDHRGNTALIWASVLGNLKIIQILIDADSEINAKNEKGETALDIALLGYMNKKAVNLLIQHKAKKGSELV